MTTGASSAIDRGLDDGLIAEIAAGAVHLLGGAMPDVEVTPQPGYVAVEVRDRVTRLTFVVSLRDPGLGDRRLAVWVLPPKDRPFEGRRGLHEMSVLVLDDAVSRPSDAIRWVADAISSVRRAAVTGLEAGRARREAEANAMQRARREAEAAELERAREAEAAAAAARAAALAREEEWARAAAERRRVEAAAREEQRARLVSNLTAMCSADFLSVDAAWASDASAGLLTPAQVDALKTAFVEQWATENLAEPLDKEQACAVAATGGDVKVVARAGSGKTRTLTARAAFLQRRCGVGPRELLLLAFNRKAAEEMRTRLAAVVGDDVPHVMTFHALAHALVHPDEALLYDDRAADQLGLSREVQEVIDAHIRSPEYHDRIRDLMLAHFRDDWERIVRKGVDLSIDESLAHRRALPRETLAGEYVKSHGEREIANALFEHAIPYQYERNRRWNGVNYRPDFTIRRPDGGIVIEYFGLEGDADYDARSEEKRLYWLSQPGWALVEYGPHDLASTSPDAFRQRVVAELSTLGVPSRRRSDEEIWQIVRQRAVDRFTDAMRTFVGRARQRNLSVVELEHLVEQHVLLTRSEGVFLQIGCSVYRGYLARLAKFHQEDFDGLLWRATSIVDSGLTRFTRRRGTEQGDLARLRFVLVDEFQDFSEMFSELLNAIRRVNPAVKFFCVGDDWQAINGFAGADVRFFIDFANRFRDAVERPISTNYRSCAAVVRAGNAVMKGLGTPAAASHQAPDGRVQVALLDRFDPTAFERERHQGDELTPALLRLIRQFLEAGSRVALLSRRNRVAWYVAYRPTTRPTVDGLERFLSHIRSFLAEEDRERVTISTVHGYKGLEADTVIVLDALEGSYPLVHPSWSFNRVFGDRIETLVDEERRLFYVAVTRARESLVLITERERWSQFLLDLEGIERLPLVDWAQLPEMGDLRGARVEIQVLDSFRVKDELKRLGYAYAPNGRYWHRSFLEVGFDPRVVLAQAWASDCGEILARTAAGEVLRLRQPSALERWPEASGMEQPPLRMATRPSDGESDRGSPDESVEDRSSLPIDIAGLLLHGSILGYEETTPVLAR